ncbi:peroxisomal membrane anchor protein conserved region-domain-containing protein [Podospora appendiculata]|uniref:Peroxisomal membrane protein PEX14 n=1 Tax=Podospora appendiculata TaxID=314037 RepID=A0AAE0XG80_9PEZI|nr:peroxisomal membrane anchor protein conserved region-domain-containing protein [Podospora appendiculata]
MAIREDLVASAAQFLQDPSVASSPIEKRIAFLQAKNLTQEEVSAALARVGSEIGPPQAYAPPSTSSQAIQQQQPPPYYAQYPQQQQQQQYPPYAWPQAPPAVPRRDWRDWFIMATVVGGVSYGLFNLGKRYVYPLIAPPTPERLEQDKKSIDEQFEKTFALVDQLAKDTETLKAAEQERTERLDTALNELESVISDLKSANRRRDDEAQRVRDDVQNLKESIPRAMNTSKDQTDNRLKELNAELKSLKTLISQRMNPTATSASVSNYLRPTSGNATPSSPAVSPAPTGNENVDTTTASTASTSTNSKAATVADEQPKREYPDFSGGVSRSSPFSSGAKASIPAWQMMASKGATSTSTSTPAPAPAAAASSSSVADAGTSSSAQGSAGSA